MELAAKVEDLTYQLSTAQEELQAAIQRAEQAEVSSHSGVKVIHKVTCRISMLESSNLAHFFHFSDCVYFMRKTIILMTHLLLALHPTGHCLRAGPASV